MESAEIRKGVDEVHLAAERMACVDEIKRNRK
jgi:hypothetical protein